MMEVETELFSQASAWSKSFTPLRTVVAEVADSMSVSVLVLPREFPRQPSRLAYCLHGFDFVH